MASINGVESQSVSAGNSPDFEDGAHGDMGLLAKADARVDMSNRGIEKKISETFAQIEALQDQIGRLNEVLQPIIVKHEMSQVDDGPEEAQPQSEMGERLTQINAELRMAIGRLQRLNREVDL